MKEKLAVFSIIFFFVFLNSANFISGILNTPKNSVFLGTTHWPGDYFYYLSQFAQGEYSWFTGNDLYTADFPQKTFVGWVNMFLGHVFHLLGINQIWAYQISVVIFTALFLWLSYLLIKEIFEGNGGDGGNKGKRLVAFALFNFANSWPTGADYWFNNGVPLVRLVGVPHQMLGKSMLVMALLLFIWWMKGRRNVWMLIGLILASIILASVEPIHWVLVIITFIIFYIVIISISLLAQRNRGKKGRPGGSLLDFLTSGNAGEPSDIASVSPRLPLGKKIYANIPRGNFLIEKAAKANLIGVLEYWSIGVFFFLSGLPMLLYLKKLFSLPPYSQLALWEATQQQYVGVWHFILSNGPVALLAILGIFFFIRQLASQGQPLQGWTRMNVVIFTVLTVGLFFSPIPAMISVVNVRFLPAVTTIFFAALATEAIYKLPKRKLVLTAIFILSLWPLPGQIQKRITFDKNNAYYYVPQSVVDTMNTAGKVSKPADTFLVIWPFNVPFPGVTGRRVYAGHHLLTIDAAKKEEFAWKFFDGQMSIAQMREFLAKNSVDFIISYSWTEAVKRLEGLEKVYDNGYLAMYKIN